MEITLAREELLEGRLPNLRIACGNLNCALLSETFSISEPNEKGVLYIDEFDAEIPLCTKHVLREIHSPRFLSNGMLFGDRRCAARARGLGNRIADMG